MAQSGSAFITNYQLRESEIDNQNRAIEQDNDRVMLFANRRGILTYDGVEWDLIKTPSVPFSLVNDTASGRIYIGCEENFGYMEKDDRGLYVYTSLSGQFNGIGEVTQILIADKYVYFYSAEALFKAERSQPEHIEEIRSNPSEPFTGITRYKDQVYLNVTKLGLHKLDKSGFSPLAAGSLLADAEILLSVQVDEGKMLIGTSDTKFFLFNGDTFQPFVPESESYLKESILSGGIDLSGKELALATLTGGCVIIDKRSGKTNYIINYQNGLPDDEIFAMGKDNYGGLWVAHEYGISRIDNVLPVKNFSTYPGLEGNLTSMVDFNGSIYVSTSRGVFYLAEVKDFKEVEILIKAKQEKQSTGPEWGKKGGKDLSSGGGSGQDTLSKTKTKRELRREKRNERKEKKTKEKEKEPEEPEKEKSSSRTKNKGPEEKTKSVKVYALQSVKHVFRKVEGLDEKCRQLAHYGGGILVATNTGLYNIVNNKASVLIKDQYINFIYQSTNPKRFYVASSAGFFSILLDSDAGKWVIENDYSDFNESVYSIAEDNKGMLWLGCENVVYRVIRDKSSKPLVIIPYDFDIAYSERVLAREIMGRPYFFLSSGLYTYNETKDSILFSPDEEHEFPSDSKYIFPQKNFTWIFTGSEWRNLNRTTGNAIPQDIYLELIDNIQHIYVDAEKHLWVIDGNNLLYKIRAVQKPLSGAFYIHLKQITNDSGFSISISKLELDYTNNSLEFHLSAPYYIKKGSTQYQFYVEGLMSGWSGWTNNPTIQLPYIPPGKYTLRVRARNVLGEISGERVYDFFVAPPFWKTWWFYLACSLTGIVLIWLLVKMRERNLRRSNKILEEKVRLRTEQLEKQTIKTEELLLNILPAETAEELKTKGKATARHYDMVSVLFTDFKGFTKIAESIGPEELVRELDVCFVKFDEIVAKYGIEKIKTIGDAYMCAGGLPIRSKGNPVLITLAGLEICRFMQELGTQKKRAGQPYWELRMGIHTGPVVAGVVGKKKFAYDIWGDTVNTASRMESSGEPGKVNVSGTTFELIKDYFDCTFRGKVDAKNKGKIDMYFVNGIKPAYSQNGNGSDANEAFKEIISRL